MKAKVVLILMSFVIYYTNAMEIKQKHTGLENMFIEQPPSLEFQAAWHAVSTNQNIPLHLQELADRIRMIQELGYISEKKLFINLLSNTDFSDSNVKKHFHNLIKKYIRFDQKYQNKSQLLGQMLAQALLNANNLPLAKLSYYSGADVNAKHIWGGYSFDVCGARRIKRHS